MLLVLALVLALVLVLLVLLVLLELLVLLVLLVLLPPPLVLVVVVRQQASGLEPEGQLQRGGHPVRGGDGGQPPELHHRHRRHH